MAFGPRSALPQWGIWLGVVGIGQHVVGDLVAGWRPDEVIILADVADHLLEGVRHVSARGCVSPYQVFYPN
jgi:hypothetical protein